MATKNKDTLLQKLENLTSSFILKINHVTQRKLNIFLLKFKCEYDYDEYDHQEEKKRYYNLMTYLHYHLRNVEEANQYNEKALEIDPESIVALGNKAWILFKEHGNDDDFKSVEQILKRVDALCTDRVKLAVAKSEMAYSYARFGLLYYKRAVEIYEHVLNDVKCSDNLPVFLWQYGCGLIQGRCLRQNVIHHDTTYEDTIKCAASLLSQVANQDDNLRYKARALTELGSLANFNKASAKHVHDCGLPEEPHKMFSMAIQLVQDHAILDIPVLEQYAYQCNIQDQPDLSKDILLETLKVKKSPRALTLLARILYYQMKKKLKQKCIPNNAESQEIIKLYNYAIAAGNIAAMGYKGQLLMQMWNYKEAIEEFEKVYRLFELSDPKQEELDWKTRFLCETCHAKCLYYSSNDALSIIQAKKLLWSSIELCFDARKESNDKNKKMKLAVDEMLKLLSRGRKTPESVLEEKIMHKLVGQKDRAFHLRRETERTGMSLEQQSEMAQRLIKLHQFNEGLSLLNQMMASNTFPEELKEFTIKAYIDGAEYALKEGDFLLASRKTLLAFDMRFPNDNSNISQERLHLFLCANEQNQNLAQSVQECITRFSSLNITTCFDLMPGRLRFSSLEETMLQSSVLVILLDDMKNDDSDSLLFNISKSLMIITVSDQCVIPYRLRYLPHLPLGKLFQEDTKKWIHNFFQMALLQNTFSILKNNINQLEEK
ncbi:hypothetical protein ACJMK2_031837 [Sinanodonta woodiana]|uniref:Tetratricopeptide repeat protein n=1 Tax=Sinanodonta woodiana TaxID=1069815 RepID=A0ABD3X242_SINWO